MKIISDKNSVYFSYHNFCVVGRLELLCVGIDFLHFKVCIHDDIASFVFTPSRAVFTGKFLDVTMCSCNYPAAAAATSLRPCGM